MIKTFSMKKIITIVLASVFITSIVSCNKEVATTSTEVMQKMISSKTWYLDYSITGSSIQNFVGQSTYYITFSKNGTTKDSDGLEGTYAISNNNGQFLLVVKSKTLNGNTLNYSHVLESVGDVKMVQSYIASGQTNKTTLYFTSK
jgi:hypothetical protein